MTFSIVAFDPANGDLGVAVASKFPCVGAVVPWAKAGVGAVATQAWANTDFGPDGLRLMAGGMPAGPALDAVLEGDDGRDERQVGFVDAAGGAATFTGSGCAEWAGGVSGEHFAAQGNILAGAGVVDAMARAFGSADGELCDRLLTALMAGDAAGGDRRGRQSSALLVVRDRGGYEGRNDRYIDLRVDDHPDAPAELGRLFGGVGRHDAGSHGPAARSDGGARERGPTPPRECRTLRRAGARCVRRADQGRARGVGRLVQPRGTSARRRSHLAAPGDGAPGHHPGGVVTGPSLSRRPGGRASRGDWRRRTW